MLVVGAGASGAQIAEELLEAGRTVYLSVGPHDRPPRRYRGRDNVWWLGVLGKWEMAAPGSGRGTSPSRSAAPMAGGPWTFADWPGVGATLVGRAEGFADGVMRFAPGLAEKFRDRGRELPLRAGRGGRLGGAERRRPAGGTRGAGRSLPYFDPRVREPVLTLDLAVSGDRRSVWATGYGLDFDWLKVDAFDAAWWPRHQRGVSAEPGVYFLGLPWLSRRG